MGGHGYVTTRDYFDLETMTVEQWAASGINAKVRRTATKSA
jgi:hypothetical protein